MLFRYSLCIITILASMTLAVPQIQSSPALKDYDKYGFNYDGRALYTLKGFKPSNSKVKRTFNNEDMDNSGSDSHALMKKKKHVDEGEAPMPEEYMRNLDITDFSVLNNDWYTHNGGKERATHGEGLSQPPNSKPAVFKTDDYKKKEWTTTAKKTKSMTSDPFAVQIHQL